MRNGRRGRNYVQICTLLKASANLETLSRLDQVGEPCLGLAYEYGDRDGHASLSSSYTFIEPMFLTSERWKMLTAKGSTNQGVDGVILVGCATDKSST